MNNLLGILKTKKEIIIKGGLLLVGTLVGAVIATKGLQTNSETIIYEYSAVEPEVNESEEITEE